MMNELKKISLKRILLLTLILLAAGIFLLIQGAPGALLLLKGPADLDTIPVDQLEGQYVRTDVAIVMDWYAYTEKKSDSGKKTTTSKEYIIPVGEAEYMGLQLPAGKLDQADALIDATWNYLTDENAEFEGEPITVSGTIHRMDSQSERYFHEVVGYSDMDAATQANMLSLVLDEGKIGEKDLPTICLFAGGGLALILLGLFFLIRALTGSYQKSIKTYCAEQADPEIALERVETFYQSAEQLNGLRMGDDLLMFQEGATTHLVPVRRVVWAYQQTTQHRTNGIPTGKTHALLLNLDTGKQIVLSMKEEQAKELLAAFDQRYPDMLLGYTKDRAELYRKDLVSFCEAVRNRAKNPAPASEA